jgi:hypothetical protein
VCVCLEWVAVQYNTRDKAEPAAVAVRFSRPGPSLCPSLSLPDPLSLSLLFFLSNPFTLFSVLSSSPSSSRFVSLPCVCPNTTLPLYARASRYPTLPSLSPSHGLPSTVVALCSTKHLHP